MEKGDREKMRQFGVAVPGGMEHVGLRARMLHESRNWSDITDFFNAFNTVTITAALLEVTSCVPALTPLVAKCYGTGPADVFFRIDSKEARTVACSSGVQQGDPMGPSILCLSLRQRLKRFREEFEREVVEAFAYIADISLGHMGVTANTIKVVAFFRREIDGIYIVVNPAHTVALTERPHPDGGRGFAPAKPRRSNFGRRWGACGWCPHWHRRIRAEASNEDSEGWKRRPPYALPRKHAGQASSGPHRRRTP